MQNFNSYFNILVHCTNKRFNLISPAALQFISNLIYSKLFHTVFELKPKCIYSIFSSAQVEKSSSSALHRTPDPTSLPPPPSEPKVINITNNSVTLMWSKIHTKSSSSPLIGYSVEYFSSDLQTGWVMAKHQVPESSVTVS